MKNLYNETLKSLEKHLVGAGFKAFNARQVFNWIYRHKETDFDKMLNLSIKLRAYLKGTFCLEQLELFHKQVASDQTKKYLFKLADDHLIEAVLMQHDYGKSLCVTTQVGCNIGCSFCASGLEKKVRNLTVAEMVMQIVGVEAVEAERVSHIVIMGTGEPFDNYDNVMGFIDIANCPHGFEIGARHITVSTSGIVPKIDAFAERKTQVNLAISLHAPNDQVRSKLMKINDVYPIDALLDSVRRYVDKTNRRVTFEYILLSGVNDQISHANALSDKIRGINAYVNLIRYNPVLEFHYRPSKEDDAQAFHQQLLKRGINATLRKERGSDIDAACGQLRTKVKNKGNTL